MFIKYIARLEVYRITFTMIQIVHYQIPKIKTKNILKVTYYFTGTIVLL